MTCVKTGAQVFVQEYGCWVVCDIHQVGEVWVLRTTPPMYSAPRDRIHGTVHAAELWFDKDKQYGTMVTPAMTYHGYEGIPLGY